jgi:hypothetical protein
LEMDGYRAREEQALHPSLYQHDMLRREGSGRNGPARVAAQAEPPIVGS